MSRKRKSNSKRPPGFIGKPHSDPIENRRRFIIFIAGLFMAIFPIFILSKLDITKLPWWQTAILIIFILAGAYQMILAIKTPKNKLGEMQEKLFEGIIRGIFRGM